MNLFGSSLMLAVVSVGSFLDYDVVQDGPRTVYLGQVVIEASTDDPAPCANHQIQMVKGLLGGPVKSSEPGRALIPFDHSISDEFVLSLHWCLDPIPNQSLPVSVPRNFIFHIQRTTFGPVDLKKLLGDWGRTDSPWDLDSNGQVDGGDLVELLEGWSPDEGAT